jgi:hypothetical protein
MKRPPSFGVPLRAAPICGAAHSWPQAESPTLFPTRFIEMTPRPGQSLQRLRPSALVARSSNCEDLASQATQSKRRSLLSTASPRSRESPKLSARGRFLVLRRKLRVLGRDFRYRRSRTDAFDIGANLRRHGNEAEARRPFERRAP